jgi:hypothetical protein
MDNDAILGLLGSLYSNLVHLQAAVSRLEAEKEELRVQVLGLSEVSRGNAPASTGGEDFVDVSVEQTDAVLVR